MRASLQADREVPGCLCIAAVCILEDEETFEFPDEVFDWYIAGTAREDGKACHGDHQR